MPVNATNRLLAGPLRPGLVALHPAADSILWRYLWLVPITLLSKVPSLYVVHPDLPVKNLKEFVAYAKSRSEEHTSELQSH